MTSNWTKKHAEMFVRFWVTVLQALESQNTGHDNLKPLLGAQNSASSLFADVYTGKELLEHKDTIQHTLAKHREGGARTFVRANWGMV